MAVEHDRGADIAPHQTHHLVDAARRGDPHGVGEAQAVDAGRVKCRADAQEVGFGRAEGILTAKADAAPGRVNQLHALHRRGDDLVDVPAVAVGAQQR